MRRQFVNLYLIGCGIFPFLTDAKYVDMSYQVRSDIPIHPLVTPFTIKLLANGPQPEGYWLKFEDINTGVHLGTHLDAPCHFAERGWCVHEIPFERLIGPAVVVDITEKALNDSDAVLTPEDIERWETNNGKIPKGAILIVKSGWGKFWPDRNTFLGTETNNHTQLRSPGISPEAAEWIVNNTHVYGVGVETISLDAGKNNLFEAHVILLSANIYGLEVVANVDKLPAKGAKIYIMPSKLYDTSGASARIFAEIPDDQSSESSSEEHRP